MTYIHAWRLALEGICERNRPADTARLGFEAVGVVERFDSFLGTSKENIARKFGVRGANVFARKCGG